MPDLLDQFAAILAARGLQPDRIAADGTLHRLVVAPEGKSIAEALPAFSGGKGEIHIGTPNQVCACCRKPFTVARRARKTIRLCPADTQVPLMYSYRICGKCHALFQRGGIERDAFLVAIDAFHFGDTAEQ
jgi:hypothetical protein